MDLYQHLRQSVEYLHGEVNRLSVLTQTANELSASIQDDHDRESQIKQLAADLHSIEVLCEEISLFDKGVTDLFGFIKLTLNKASCYKDLSNVSDEIAGYIKRLHKELPFEENKKRERKNRLYAAKLKYCTRIYSNLNEILSGDLKSLKKQYTDSQTQIQGFHTSTEEVNQLENKIKRYDNELIKLEKKYPWLKDSEMTLPHIMMEIRKLENVRQQRDMLLNEINKFRGLKPDITIARQQLNIIKSEYIKINQNKLR